MPPTPLRLLAFAFAFAIAWVFHWLDGPAVTHSIIWLPSGIAVAGVWLLGMRALPIVFVATLVQRVSIGNEAIPAFLGAFGAVAEGLLGALVLRRCGARPDFARLRDVTGLFAAAALAPLISVAFSATARAIVGYGPKLSGYDGWWRMNALGVLVVVPLVTTWLSAPRRVRSARGTAETVAITLATLLLLWAVMVLHEPSPTALALLYTVLPMSLFAALRSGQRGAATTASLGAALVFLLSSHGYGPFQIAPMQERYTVVQLFELTLLTVPLVFGSLITERRDSAQQWIRSEGLRAALLNVLPDVVYRIDADGTVLDAVAPDGVPLPTPRDLLIGQRLDALMAPDLAARMHAAIREALANGRSRAIDYALQSTDGNQMREARFIRLGADEVLGVVRDTTDRAAAERMLALQARVLERIATGRSLPEVFAVIARGIEEGVRHGRCSILLLRGRRMHVAHAPSLPPAYNAAVDGFEVGPGRGTCGTAAHDNRMVVTADIATDANWSGIRDVALDNGLRACWSVPIRSSTGAVLGTFATYHERPRRPTPAEVGFVERAAVLAGIAIERQQREELLTSIQQNVAEGLFRCVPGQGLTYCNAAFATMFGYGSPEELLEAVRDGADLPARHRADLDALCGSHGAGESQDVALHRRDGSEFWARVSTTLVRGTNDVGGAYVGAIADVSARRTLEAQLRQAQKMEAIGKLAGGIAHDFNNLLTAISGYAESLGDSLPADDPRRADVRGVLDAAGRAAGLTRQLLAFSRQQLLAPRVLDLNAVAADLRDLVGGLLGARIGLRLQPAPAPALVRVDRTQMEQVILNLAVNARDAMPDGGTLTIGTTVIGPVSPAPAIEPHVLLWVRDDGVGMDAASRAHAFDPFFTTKPPGKGTGLGLSTVYGIARQSGGDAWIDSEPGRGTTVWIRLPLADAGTAPVAPDEPPPPPAADPTILLVEDEPLVRELVHRALVRAGYRVLVADDGESALAHAQAHDGRIDLLITDVVMPGLGGLDLAARLAAERPGLPVLFVSGFTGEARDLELPANAQLVHKPFAVPDLLAVVKDLLHANAR